MSDTSSNDNVDSNDDGNLAGLREAARQGKQAISENADLKRLLAFSKAGIDTDTKIGKMLLATYAGSLDDVEALKAEAVEVGAVAAPVASKTPAEIAAEAARADEDARRTAAQSNLGSGHVGAPPGEEGPHPRIAALEQFYKDIADGVDEADARTDAMARVLAAAGAGDKRVRFDAEDWARRGREADQVATGRVS